MYQSGQYIQAYCPHGYFNRNPFAIKCNSYVPDFIDRNANSTIHEKEIFGSNSCNHTYSTMGFLYEIISLPFVYLYGNICPDLFYIYLSYGSLEKRIRRLSLNKVFSEHWLYHGNNSDASMSSALFELAVFPSCNKYFA